MMTATSLERKNSQSPDSHRGYNGNPFLMPRLQMKSKYIEGRVGASKPNIQPFRPLGTDFTLETFSDLWQLVKVR